MATGGCCYSSLTVPSRKLLSMDVQNCPRVLVPPTCHSSLSECWHEAAMVPRIKCRYDDRDGAGGFLSQLRLSLGGLAFRPWSWWKFRVGQAYYSQFSQSSQSLRHSDPSRSRPHHPPSTIYHPGSLGSIQSQKLNCHQEESFRIRLVALVCCFVHLD